MTSPVRREVPRPRGPGRAILATLLVLILLAVGADFGLRFLTERWLEGRVQRTLSLPSRPDMDIGGFPFLTQFATGRFDRVEAELEDFRAGELRLDRVTIGLRDVRFDRWDALTGREGRIEVEQGTGSVEIGETAFNELLRDQGVGATVELLGPRVRASARLQVGGEEATATTTGRLRLEGGTLVFDPGEVEVDGSFGVPPAALQFSVQLPVLFEGMVYEELEVREAVAEVTVDFRGATLGV